LDVEGNAFDRMCVFDQMCQAADLWIQDESDDSNEGSDDSDDESDNPADEPIVLEDNDPGKDADDSTSDSDDPDEPFKRVLGVEIKVVTAFRGHAHQSDLGCIKIPSLQDNTLDASESGSDWETECGSDCGSDIDCYHYPAFKSKSRSNVYKKTKQEDWKMEEASSGMEDYDREDLDPDDSDTDLEEEIADIVEEEKKFCKFVGYHTRIEKLCYWVGSDYLERRAHL
jgi:hypothetical protein